MRTFMVNPVLLLSVVLAPVLRLDAQSDGKLLDSLSSLYHDRGMLNGTILVAERGEVRYSKAFGLANFEWGVPNDLDTRFMLASVTKQFVAVVTLQLVQEGKLRLDDPLRKYLPDYPPPADGVTIHQLLNHSSGIYNYTNSPEFGGIMSRRYASDEFVATFADSSLRFEPGSKYSYSNSGYYLLGVIIEKVTGKAFARVLQEYVLDRVGMPNTGFNVTREILPRRAAGYDRVFLGGHANRVVWHESSLYTAGNMYSTVGDLLRWDQALYTDLLLTKRFRDLLYMPQIAIGPEGSRGLGVDSTIIQGYGYGWFTGTMTLRGTGEAIPVVWHSGSMSGHNAMIVRDLERQHLVVVLNNVLVGREKLLALALDCLHILHERPFVAPKQSIAAVLGKEIREKGIASALARFTVLRNDTSGYALVEWEVNDLGYSLLRSDRVDEAIEVFRLNVEAFPASGNVYDSLGEAYAAKGDTVRAIANYQRSLEIDPSNDGGRQMLEKLMRR
jgi:CubicO group peptidase (beta-lactamase class C family)